MPCRCDGMEEEPVLITEEQALIEKIEKLSKLLCLILTPIFFENDDAVLLSTIKEEAKRCLWWYKEHLDDDINKCEENMAKAVIDFNFEEKVKWEKKREEKIKQHEAIKNLFYEEFK